MKRVLECIQDFFGNYLSRLTYEDEVVSYYERTPRKMTTSLSLPSSSSSSNAPKIKYDVFISFRGSDTRRGFLSHLINALSRANIEVYVDYKLKEGDELSSALCRAIEESQIALVVFSKDYASSKWCLEELVKITECMTKNGQIVVPIFYDVDPSNVRHQKGRYKNAFVKHEKMSKGNITNVEKWRSALNKVANLSGFHSSNCRTEDELIKVVTGRVLTRLKNMNQSVDLKCLVGIDKPIADLKSLMSCIESEDVGVIGIWGMGGLGKTTIAGVLFNRLYSEFEVCCFQPNVREETEKYGIPRLKNNLISILLEEDDLKIDIPSEVPDHVLRRLRRKKVLVVLDDVNHPNQIESLIGGHDWLGGGSRIIVTTRDKHVIEREADCTYEVKALGSHDDALQLLKFHAFTERYPQMSWHDDLMMKVVEYAQGIPLALEVLGKFLYGKTAEQWEDQLQKLQKMPFEEIQNVLRLSYEGLDDEEQCIFLYIASFFEGRESKADVEALLGEFGYSVSIALKTLEDRALIRSISANGECVSMHDLIREMGRGVIREKSFDKPGEWKHLWDPNDICRVLKHHEGTDSIESITLNLARINDLSISPQSFARMVNLRLLRIYQYFDTHARVHLPEGLEKLSDKIKLFHWDGYPLTFLPATFNPDNLVELRMVRSHVTKLWDSVANLPSLKRMDLSFSLQLVELPDLSKAPNLQYLDLRFCENVVSVHSSILSLPNVEVVQLTFCRRFEEFSAIEALPSYIMFHSKLRLLNLEGCVSLKHLPDSMSKLTSLKELFLGGCKKLETSNLQIIFDGLHSLTHLTMDGCCKLYELPENINKLSSLCHLSLSETNVKSLPQSIKHLSQLHYLCLNICTRLQSIPELPPSLEKLRANDCTSLERVFTHSGNIYFLETDVSFRNCPNLDKDVLDAIAAYVKCYKERRAEMWWEMGCLNEIDDDKIGGDDFFPYLFCKKKKLQT